LTGATLLAQGWGWRHAGRRAWAVGNLDLTVPAGQRLLLLGASGSGKSTLLAGLGGLLHGQESGQAAGELLVDGVRAYDARHRTGFLLQDPDSQLVMNRSGDDVAFGPECHGVPADQIWPRVDEAMEAVGFGYSRDRPTAALSGGEKQRLALAGQLANRPGLLLLDEPTANLDPDGGALVRAAVASALAATRATLVVVEHRVEEWLPIIDRVVVLGFGELVADGEPDLIFGRYRAELERMGVWVPGTVVPPAAGRSVAPATVLEADGVSYRHRGAPADAVRSTSLVLHAGEALAVVGPNGSGKTTLAMMLAGLATPRTGSVLAPDSDRPLHRRRPASLVRAVGTVFQQPEHQFVRPTVRDELVQAPRRLGWSAERSAARADELLDRLGLAALAQANPFTLSGGQQRRLSVATALSGAPPALILDEPTFGQDARTWRELLALLQEVRDAGTALVTVSHDRPFVTALADRVLPMADGTVAA